MWSLNHKRVLITGGTKGIGRAAVMETLKLGAEVLFTARAEEMAAIIAFLAMNASSYITGQNVVSDGGMSATALFSRSE